MAHRRLFWKSNGVRGLYWRGRHKRKEPHRQKREKNTTNYSWVGRIYLFLLLPFFFFFDLSEVRDDGWKTNREFRRQNSLYFLDSLLKLSGCCVMCCLAFSSDGQQHTGSCPNIDSRVSSSFSCFFFLSATAESGARNCCWGTLGRAHTPVSSICRTSGGYCIFFFWRRPSLRWNSHPWKSRAQSSAHSLSHFVFYIFSHTHLVFSIFFFFLGSSYRLKEAADTLQC